jgi:hypothetical protein
MLLVNTPPYGEQGCASQLQVISFCVFEEKKCVGDGSFISTVSRGMPTDQSVTSGLPVNQGLCNDVRARTLRSANQELASAICGGRHLIFESGAGDAARKIGWGYSHD